MKRLAAIAATVGAVAFMGIAVAGSSHREAPGITKTPKLDGTDFYMFRSFEAGRTDYVTFLANYLPLQDVYGGPNFFTMDPDAVYEIHVDNTGDAKEDLTFQFRFQNTYKGLTVPAGGQNVEVPLINIGPIGPTAAETGALNVLETYGVSVIRGPRRTGSANDVTNAATGSAVFRKPVDRIGDKSLSNYASYANDHIYDINIPGCPTPGRMFVGQRREGFVVNLGEVFDLINTNPVGAINGEPNVLADKNVTTLALEVPTKCLVSGNNPIIGAWTTASEAKNDEGDGGGFDRLRGVGRYTQVSRLGDAAGERSGNRRSRQG
jgi:hypothetical protein